MTPHDLQSLEQLVQHLRHVSYDHGRWQSPEAQNLMLRNEIQRLLMVLETEERDLQLAQERLRLHLALLSKLRERLYNERQSLSTLAKVSG